MANNRNSNHLHLLCDIFFVAEHKVAQAKKSFPSELPEIDGVACVVRPMVTLKAAKVLLEFTMILCENRVLSYHKPMEVG